MVNTRVSCKVRVISGFGFLTIFVSLFLMGGCPPEAEKSCESMPKLACEQALKRCIWGFGSCHAIPPKDDSSPCERQACDMLEEDVCKKEGNRCTWKQGACKDKPSLCVDIFDKDHCKSSTSICRWEDAKCVPDEQPCLKPDCNSLLTNEQCSSKGWDWCIWDMIKYESIIEATCTGTPNCSAISARSCQLGMLRGCNYNVSSSKCEGPPLEGDGAPVVCGEHAGYVGDMCRLYGCIFTQRIIIPSEFGCRER